jgi:hypothetical protein
MKTKTLYLLSDKISWTMFKQLQDVLVRDSGPTMVHMDKALWEMNKAHRLYCGFLSDMKDDMWLGLELPKGYIIKVIRDRNVKKLKHNKK